MYMHQLLIKPADNLLNYAMWLYENELNLTVKMDAMTKLCAFFNPFIC